MFDWIKSIFKRVAQSCAVRKHKNCAHELNYHVLGATCKKCNYSSLADDYGMYD